MDEILENKKYKIWKVLIHGCPYMIHEYKVSDIEMETFTIYLDQLQLFYCTYMIRYYGLVIKKARTK